MGFGAPLTGFSAAETTTLLPPYNSVPIDSFFPRAAAAVVSTAAVVKSDSRVTYNHPKRARDYSTTNRFASYSSPTHSQINCGCNYYFLGEDISIQIQQQQFDLDRLISHHMEKVRSEVAEKRRRILEAIELGTERILRNKEEEMEKMLKLNYELEERVNSLFIENQIWRDVAETNEATANALRINLEQILNSQVKTDVDRDGGGAESSCCGSNYEAESEEKKRRKLGEDEDRKPACKKCWKEESCVLLLPCRHLCLCTVCGSSLQNCSICNSVNNASVRVIMP